MSSKRTIIAETHPRSSGMLGIKKHLQMLLQRFRLYNRIKTSFIYTLYWNIANPRIIEERSIEIDFYRQILVDLPKEGLIIDVGANHGHKTDVFLRMGARVVAVEPDQFCQKVLRQKYLTWRIAKRKVEIVGKALSDKNAIGTFLIEAPGSAENTLSMKWVEILRRDQDRFRKQFSFGERSVVETTTLDELILTHGQPFFVKIDVEGSEVSVLRGLTKPVPFLSFEVNLPEFRLEGQECIELLYNIVENGRFNYSADCQQGLALAQWLRAEEFMKVFQRCEEKSIEIFWKTEKTDSSL